ncbi:MAG: hypothetical protein SPH83_02120 [Treponema sp.]|nr:hypothetical protein [Spirochaetales bacterium]MDY6189277.1 hypothetical protein [Treponema sp.]
MKTKKVFAALFATFMIAASVSAFDGATFWKEYGGGIKNGDSVVHIGASLNFHGLNVNGSYEKAVHINDMLPFTFGGTAGCTFVSGGCMVNVDALAKYHFNFGVEPLDVYAGVLLGANVSFPPNFGFDYGGFAGATWFFTDKMGVTLEGGYPYWLNAKFTLKF